MAILLSLGNGLPPVKRKTLKKAQVDKNNFLNCKQQTMGGGSVAKDHPWEYFSASAMAAAINYPLWRASAIGQSGFRVSLPSTIGSKIPPAVSPYIYAFGPPYKGMVAVVAGMTWARAAIFWGSDRGKEFLLQKQICGETLATVLPPLVVSTLVQCINMPIVRASITLQNPESGLTNTIESIKYIYKQHGIDGLWHGTSAGTFCKFYRQFVGWCSVLVVKSLFFLLREVSLKL